MTGAEKLVHVDDDGGLRTITLARPERHNALIPELLEQLLAALDVPSPVRAVVLAAEGRSFSTGGDVAAFAARDGDERVAYARRIVGRLNEVVLAMLRLRVPVVAAVHGPVTGGSIGLVLASDLVLVGRGAWFAPYYVDVGFSPDGGWTALLPDRIGATRAAAIQLANDRVDAETAVDWGLASRLVDGDVAAAAQQVARNLTAKVPGSVERTKRLLVGDVEEIERRLDAELESFVDQIATSEATDGMAAFLRRQRTSTDRSQP